MFRETVETYAAIQRISETKLFPDIPSSCKPFLKWAGGKSQLIPSLKKFIPKKYNAYIEPFIGGGAVFFHLNHGNSIISDLNEELIVTYETVRDHVEDLIDELDTYINTESFFYKIRKLNPSELTKVERASRIIFLNKTCFNGLYRVNRKGEFNVPYNNGLTKNFYDKKNLLYCSKCLENTKILHCDYSQVLSLYAKKGDFIFLDPPYQPVGKYADFKRYTKERFHEKDHIDLYAQFKKLVDKGCKVILTNSDHSLIHELFKDFQIEIVETKRLISSDATTRTGKDIIILGGI